MLVKAFKPHAMLSNTLYDLHGFASSTWLAVLDGNRVPLVGFCYQPSQYLPKHVFCYFGVCVKDPKLLPRENGKIDMCRVNVIPQRHCGDEIEIDLGVRISKVC